METLFVFIAATLYALGLMIIPATLLAAIVLMICNIYCKKRFGEPLFKRGED